MREYEKPTADFWAHLASIPDWGAVTKEQRLRLRAEYGLLCMTLGHPAVQPTPLPPSVKNRQYKALTSMYRRHDPQEPASYDTDLAHLHRIAQEVIVPLLQGHPTNLPMLHGTTRQATLTTDGRVAVTVTSGRGVDILTNALGQLLENEEPFPFRRCPQCGAVFAPLGNQQRCSSRCTVDMWATANRPARREYMKKYMQQRRRAAKHATAA